MEHLNAINRLSPSPWDLSFSFRRTLRARALNAWSGVAANFPKTQKAFRHRAQCNSRNLVDIVLDAFGALTTDVSSAVAQFWKPRSDGLVRLSRY